MMKTQYEKCAGCKAPMAPAAGPPVHGLCWFCASAALDEALEVLAPFYLHGKAQRNANPHSLHPLNVISKVGVSALVGGAFSSAIEFFEKYGVRKSKEGKRSL